MAASNSVSVVIPTFAREAVLVETVERVLEQAETLARFERLFVIDQTKEHSPDTEQRLRDWREAGRVSWIRLEKPHLTRAMNLGLLHADSDIVLYTDDDVVPAPGWLGAHVEAYRDHPEASAIVGQVLQPGEIAEDIPCESGRSNLFRDLEFSFRSTRARTIENAMAGNLSVRRQTAIAVGGFDEKFTPPVASRFETEFAKRLVKHGHTIWFEPKACIHHLRADTGGTRSMGSHLNSISPRFGVGDYYYALRHGRAWEAGSYSLRRLFREVRTRYHLQRPWWIPVKFIGELRAINQALRLARSGPALLQAPVPTQHESAPGG